MKAVNAAGRTSVTRTARLLLAFVLATIVVTLPLVLGVRPAHAAAGDQLDSFDIAYVVQPSGVVSVQETIDYRFGSSGRHGIDRNLVTREPYDKNQDAVYTISNVRVSSPDNVSTQVARSTTSAQKGRERVLRLRIGDANRTITSPSATYVISYDLAGAMRSFPDKQPPYDEFYWDATGLGWDAPIARVAISVQVPEGVQDTTCTYGPPKSTQKCGQKIVDGTAQFTQTGIGSKEGVTIGNKIKPGVLADASPDLERSAAALSPAQLVGVIALAAVTALSLILAPILGVRYWRRKGRDLRYDGLPPGTTPQPGQPVSVVPNDPDIPIPVAFSPPRIPVAEAGLLVDGQVDPRETAGTIIDLAVRGALSVRSDNDSDFRVTLVDPGRATAPHEVVLLNEIFGGAPIGAVADLSEQGSMLDAHQQMATAVRNQVAGRGWFTEVPKVRAGKTIGVGAVGVLVVAAFGLGPAVLLVALPLLPILATVAIVRSKMRRGQRTPDGRAVCDQVEGFRTYLATAEADQLRFEEGEDIFSRYLPWAIVFDLADRWATLCADLVTMGRLPDTTPYWYYGNYHFSAFNTGFLVGAVTSAATPMPTASSGGGTGFGGGSSFGGGGFSGGGGGGGGGGSW